MSAFDDGGMANVLAPLKHSLIRNIPQQPPVQLLPGMDNPAMQLQTAAAMGKPQGRAPMPAAGPGTKGPMGRDLYKTLMLKQAGIDEDQKDYHALARDPNVTPDMLNNLLKTYRPPAPEQHGPGSIEIKRGTGPRAMGEEAINQWMQRAAHSHAPGEEVTPEYGQAPVHGLGRAQMIAPPQGPTEGFKVSNIAPPAQPKHRPTKEERQQTLDEQRFQHQKEMDARAGRHEEESNKHATVSENRGVLSDLEKHEKQLLEGDQTDAGVQKDLGLVRQQMQDVRQRLQGFATPAQPAPAVPKAPKPGAKLTTDAIRAISAIPGITREKAHALAQQQGWSF